MKKIQDMDHQEIIALSEETLKRMVDYRCAEDGIPILECPTAPDEPAMETDQVAYQVEGLTVTDRELAGKLSLLLVDNKDGFFKVNYDYKLGSKYQYLELVRNDYRGEAFGSINKITVYSRDTINAQATALADYKIKKDQYNKDSENYKKWSSERTGIVNEIYGVYNEHVGAERNLEHARREFERYLELAGGDLAIAFRFYDKAYKPNPWTSYHLRKLAGMDTGPEQEPDFYDERKGE